MSDGLPAFRESADLKHMDLAWPDFKLHLNPVCLGFGRHANAIVPNDLVVTNLNKQRRNAGKIAKYR